MQRSGEQALEQLLKGTVNESAAVQQGQDVEEVASEAVKVFNDLETMGGLSDESEAETEHIEVWSVSFALKQKK